MDIEIKEAEEDEYPVCPFCKKKLDLITAKRMERSILPPGQRTVYWCPSCKKVLGISETAWVP